MSNSINHLHYDVVVVGAGSAGLAAAAGAAKEGAKTLLVDAGPSVGGELLTGMTVDGAINARGEWIIGGVLNEIIEELKERNGYVGAYNDYRLIRYVCCDPVVMQIAVMKVLQKNGVEVLLHTYADNVVTEGGRVTGIVVRNKSGRTLITAGAFIDCSGDGDICADAGAPYEYGAPDGELQPLSIMFRMSGVETEPLLSFVKKHPEYVAVGESEAIREGRTDQELVDAIYEQGQPSVFFKGDGPFLADAIERGKMFPTALIMIQPTSEPRQEVCVNATRVAHVSGLNTKGLSGIIAELYDQVDTGVNFLRSSVPGFENAALSGVAPRVGIRETRRIMGDYKLTEKDVMDGRKFDDGITKGCHHIDIHQEGTKQVRIAVANGGSYDIPYGCLIPLTLENVLIAGRCMSADRPAHGSARLMGSCIGMGQAAGTAAAMMLREGLDSTRAVDPAKLRTRLKEHGAIVDGTH